MIRAYQSDDRTICADILTRAMTHAFYWTDVEAISPEDFDKLTEGEVIRVLEYEGSLCGVSSVWAADNFLHHFYIAPKMHRQGMGRILLEDALIQHGGRLSLKCQAQNIPARTFYSAMGFIETDEAGGDEGPFGPWIWVRTPAAIAGMNRIFQ